MKNSIALILILVLAANNAKPAIEAINTAIDTAKQAQSTWASARDLVAPLMNGHVYTVIITVAITVAAIYLGMRVWRRIRRGEVSA